jgi:hypothetical protein
MEMSQALGPAFCIQAARSSHDIITLDGSWLYFIMDHEFIRPAQGEEILNAQKRLSC